MKGGSGMRLTANDIARMIDLSCVRTTSNKADIDEMVEAARKYGFGQVSVLQCFIPYTKQLLERFTGYSPGGECELPIRLGFHFAENYAGKRNDGSWL